MDASHNQTTAMGARLLRGWLGAPTRDFAAWRAAGRVEALVVDARARGPSPLIWTWTRRRIARARLSAINPRERGPLRPPRGAPLGGRA